MKTPITSLIVTICCIGLVSTVHADVSGSAVMNACAPTQGVAGRCAVKKTSVNDPQQTHSQSCMLTKEGVQEDSYSGTNHVTAFPETHSFPVPDLETEFDEGVTFCVINTSHWWDPSASAFGQDCRTTRSG
jgi:hypothetical protein